MLNIALLGSTGSIGDSTLKVIESNRDLFTINLISAKSNYIKVLNQCKLFKPKYVFLKDKSSAHKLKESLVSEDIKTEIIFEETKYLELISSSETDIVVAGIVGLAGLNSVYHSINSGKKVLLANKESYVAAGEYLNTLASKKESTVIPIDSEHCAIHQCISSASSVNGDVSEIILTGSGGPLLNTKQEEFREITPEEATNHPIWRMGKKISVDSATLMNKGLELIEAKWLFNIGNDRIKLVIHPEGIVHSLVEFSDRSVVAQMSVPDMRIPISYGLGFPTRINSGAKKLSLTEIGSLTFLKPNFNKFPCLILAQEALKVGGTAPCLLNAANEEAVNAFLDKRIRLDQIPEIIEFVMNKMPINAVEEIESILEADNVARTTTKERIERKSETHD